MFSNNQKISMRQVRRLLILDMFGASSLLLPGLLARQTKGDGVFCIAGGAVLACLYVWVLGRVMKNMEGSYYQYMKKLTGTFVSDILMLFYLLYFLLLSAFVLYELTGLIHDWLLPDMNRQWMAFLELLLAAYATKRGIEGRARIYEIMFWCLGVPLLLMLGLAAGEVNPDYWAPVWNSSWQDFGTGILTVCAFFLPIFFVLFLKPYCSKPERLSGCGKWAIGITAVLNVGIYLILLGHFQPQTTAALQRPVITLMSMVQLPGGFFARLDAFMTAIWFFSLFALMNTAVFYSSHILEELFSVRGEKKKYALWAVLLPIYGLVWGFLSYEKIRELYRLYIANVAMPALVLLPLLLLLLGSLKGKSRKNVLKGSATLGICIISCLLLGGCGTKELEDRSFPLAIAIDKQEEGLILSFDFPDLSENQEGKNPSGTSVGFSVEGNTWYEAQKAYENNNNRTLDYNHLKAIIISQDFLSDGELLREALTWMEQEEVVARNTCLFLAEDSAAKLLTLTEDTNGSVGKYLEQMTENQEDFRSKAKMTIGKLLNQWHNQNELLLIPVLTDNGGVPSITSYGVMDAFSYKGNISAEQAMKAFWCQGMLRNLTWQLKGGQVLELSGLRTKVDIQEKEGTANQKEGEEAPVVVNVRLSADVTQKSAGEEQISQGQLKKRLNEQVVQALEQAERELLEEKGIDMTNSFIKLGGHNRGLYQAYCQDYEGYLQGLEIAVETDFRIVQD